MRLIDVYAGDPPYARAVAYLYHLLKERPSAANISHQALPSIFEHTDFVMRRPYRYWYLIEAPSPPAIGELVGSISATVHNEIGIFIDKAHQRRGYARAAIEQFRLRHAPLPGIPSVRNPRWLANVAPGNDASHKLFIGLGAKPISTTYEL